MDLYFFINIVIYITADIFIYFRNQTNLLLKTRAQLEHAMKETEHPLRVNSENIYTRFVMILMLMLVMN